MASITAQQSITGSRPAPPAEDQAQTQHDYDHGLARFFYAAAAALILSAIQGVVQRLPGISDWLRDADYGGHMVTNLAQTHITIVGAGTISMTGLIYYVLPRVCRRPLYSQALTNLSFWATLFGVFGFYLAMLSVGTYEGMMVHAGWPYDAAREWMGALHKAPMAMTAAVMGLGYWTFVTNVYVTVGRAAGERKVNPATGATDSEFLLAKFFAVAATGLLFGTVQGVYQVLPWSLDWLRSTGAAGHMIDPMAHAHMNLVGGVSVAIMGLLYYFLPRMLGRPIYSLALGKFSFWCIVIGVFGFYFSAIGLGWIEGEMVLGGLTDVEAKEAMGLVHPLLLSTTATIMGVGFWTFITNILLTLRGKPAADAPVDATLRKFIGFSVVAILIGTVQGVVQILPWSQEWLEDGLPSSYFVTPLSHAQLNMVGFAIVALMTMSIFLLPRILGRPVVDPRGGRTALLTICAGISLSYLVYLGVGLIETNAIHNGATATEARQTVAGPWGRYVLFAVAQGILGIGYILLFRHISAVIGVEERRAYFRAFRGRMRDAGKASVRVHPRALSTNRAENQRRGLVATALEAVGFLGLGWFYSGRPFIGVMLMSGWVGFLTIIYVVLAILEDAALLGALLLPYVVCAILSAIGCYRSYMRDARETVLATS
ncbi:MAG: cbb3-type cytochrome c oxidase subunit I [Chloroflexota bacterium]|nr:cbb3-type cytochrome c oxidase subunit I [Chloroflexota bacterium]